MKIETQFNPGDRVRHITELNGTCGVVISFMVRGNNHSYEIQWDIKTTMWHLDFELMPECAPHREIGWKPAP